MAFGKKKKEKKVQHKAVIRYNKQNNPLYPDKVENDVKAVCISIGTVILSVMLVGVIAMNFSYAVHPEKLQAQTGIGGTGGQENRNPADTGNGSQDLADAGNDGAEDVLQESVPMDDNRDDSNAQSGAVSNTIGIPAEEPTELTDPPEAEGDYILPESASRKLTKEEVKSLTKEQLRYARNEIYARHGRRFQDEALQQYFDSKSWYQGNVAPESFNEAVLSQVEKDNIDLIKKYE